MGEVLIAVDDNDDGQLLPDTNVTVTVTVSTQSNAMTIPKEALHVENGKPFVFRIEGDGLKRTPVIYGNMNINQVAILSGLKEGDWVATGTLSGQPFRKGCRSRKCGDGEDELSLGNVRRAAVPAGCAGDARWWLPRLLTGTTWPKRMRRCRPAGRTLP